LGLQYWVNGPDSKRHDARPIKFVAEESTIYAPVNGGGIGMTNPKVHSDHLGEPAAPDWWHTGPKSFPLGNSAPTLYFHSEIKSVKFVGYKKERGGVAIAFGERAPGDTSDSDFHPMYVSGLKFEDMAADSYLRFGTSSSAGKGLRNCLQIDCDGRRNSLLIDVDGSLLGDPGTIVPRPQKFYDKLGYVDPMGFDTMEDLIPMPQRYDRFGDAIPFPKEVNHGHGGGLEYACKDNSKTTDGAPGCEVLFMQKGYWLTKPGVPALAPAARIVAVREDGGLIRLDAIHHGWAYATGWVRTGQCMLTMHWDPKKGGSTKPESQHARRYGRVRPGEFGAHRNSSRIKATIGPVYTQPGIWRKGCTFEGNWSAYKCIGGQHRHLVLEVMDWNHMDRRWAPVTVEVNDQWAPQGGTLNVLTGPAMMWPGKRLQTFHALGHLGLRHNVYFSGDPPQHMRFHLQYSPPQSGIVVCMYYGIPNMIYAYVNGRRKAPMAGATPNWDNLVLTKLVPSMPHGTYFYDRVGVETGRPGYLYTVIRGGNTIDFKISHKIKLTTKITVTADWGGWKNQSGDNFFRKGIDGLVRNIALLVGAPPSRVKILGEGSAQKGTFWNEDTTSKDFAEWIWKQNKSMAYSSRDHWMTAPTSRGLVNATAAQINGSALPETAVLGAQGIHVQFLQGFAAERHGQVAAALRRDGSQQWLGHWSKLTEKEQQLILERRAEDELDEQATSQVETILRVQETERQRKLLPPVCNNVTGDCDVSIVVNVDGDDNVPASTGASADAKSMRSAKATEEHAWNTEEGTIEDETDNVLERCRFDSSKQGCVIQSRNHVSLLESADLGNSDNTSEKLQFLQVVVDNVKNMNSPKGWTCDSSLYNDGKCNCDCGIWDPDCDKGADMVPSIVNEDLIELLDKKHVKALLNLVDGDGNSNGVLDGGEVLGLDKRLGQSALIGVAKRIIEAQEMGENKRSLRNGVIRLGNFAMFSATETDACDHLLKNVPLDKKLAVYRPVCVRDSEFTEVDEEPSGRCALLPDMQKGSQCLVPGDGVGVSLSHNPAISSTSNASNATPFVPSPKAVCGLLSLLFSKNQGVGGHRSGVGVTSAKWTDPGAELVVQTGQQEIYIEKKKQSTAVKILQWQRFVFLCRDPYTHYYHTQHGLAYLPYSR